MKGNHEINEHDLMHASPRQCELQQWALTQSGKNRIVGFQPRARALDLGKAGGDRANPSPTCPPDLCAIPAMLFAAMPQRNRSLEIIRRGEARSASSFIICLCKQCNFTKLIDVFHVHLLGGRQAEHRALSLGGRNHGTGLRSQSAGTGSDGKRRS